MGMVKPLPPEKLALIIDQTKLPWQNSKEIPQIRTGSNYKNPFQLRVWNALEKALAIDSMDFHVFLSGEMGFGRAHILAAFLESRLRDKKPPCDIVYTYNFENPDSPLLLELPAGKAKEMARLLDDLIENISSGLQNLLEANEFNLEKSRIPQTLYQKVKSLSDNLVLFLEKKDVSPNCQDAVSQSVTVRENPESGFIEQFSEILSQIGSLRNDIFSDAAKFQEKIAIPFITRTFNRFEKRLLKIADNNKTRNYLSSLKKDILKNFNLFLPLPTDPEMESFHAYETFTQAKKRYKVNIFIDHSKSVSKPVIWEQNPTAYNLLGCIERENEMGALTTNFSLIRAGSLHKANGGILILRLLDLLKHPLAWDGLLQALLTRRSQLEENTEIPDLTGRAKGLSPEAIPLHLTVILIGNEELYEELLYKDERFQKLFRMKAQIKETFPRSLQNTRNFLLEIGSIIRQENLLPFDSSALAWLITFSSRLSENQNLLSLKFSRIREIMMEASAQAKRNEKETIDGSLLEATYLEKQFRENMLEEYFHEEYGRKILKLSVTGNAIGQANGLMIISSGDYEFGFPHKITCSIGVGHDGIVDLEREVDFAGPSHSKGMLILNSFITRHFACRKPVVFTGSIYIEQNYADVDGDSASGAELAALLSALANIPLRQDIAFTGAISHTGDILAVGGVSAKIEGFYKVCKQKGFTGTQGVIIPFDNMEHLNVSSEIRESSAQGEFSIYPVKYFHEALEILSGMKTGKQKKNGSYTKGSFYALVDERLTQLGLASQHPFKNNSRKSK